MNGMYFLKRLKGITLLGVLGLSIWATGSQAQITTPLHIGASIPIVDEFDIPLKGTFWEPGDVVQVLWASNGVIHPPGVEGLPDPSNPLLEGGVTGIGANTSPYLPDYGIFGLSIAQHRPKNGDRIFVRVFNASCLKRASFYADSHVFTVQGNTVFDVGTMATTNALDNGDDDQDGLINSWELSLMSNPLNKDTDGDGVTDGDEFRAGTDVLDAQSFFALTAIERADGQSFRVQWQAVSGRTYRVQFGSLQLRNTAFMDVSTGVMATGRTACTVIPDGMNLGKGFFRVVTIEN